MKAFFYPVKSRGFQTDINSRILASIFISSIIIFGLLSVIMHGTIHEKKA